MKPNPLRCLCDDVRISANTDAMDLVPALSQTISGFEDHSPRPAGVREMGMEENDLHGS
jgi:hypothetical protein